MAKLLQLRRGTTNQHSSFTGEVGEVTVDTDKDVLVVHDNSTAGGHVMLGETQAKTFGAMHTATQSGATMSIDLGNGSNQTITVPASSNVTNIKLATGSATLGQSGSIFFIINDTAGISGFAAAKFLFTGGANAPASSTTAGSVDRLDYIVYDATSGSEKLHCVYSCLLYTSPSPRDS